MDEALREKLLKQAREDKRVFKGASPVGVALQGVVRPGIKKLGASAAHGLKPQQQATRTIEGTFDDIPAIVKRTDRQRVEHMAERLWKSVAEHNWIDVENCMRLLQAEGWKVGQTITYEDIKTLVIEQMKLAASKMQEQKQREF